MEDGWARELVFSTNNLVQVRMPRWKDFYCDLIVLQVNNFKEVTTKELPRKKRLKSLAWSVMLRRQIKQIISTPIKLITTESLSPSVRWVGAVDLTGFNLFPCSVHFHEYKHDWSIWRGRQFNIHWQKVGSPKERHISDEETWRKYSICDHNKTERLRRTRWIQIQDPKERLDTRSG